MPRPLQCPRSSAAGVICLLALSNMHDDGCIDGECIDRRSSAVVAHTIGDEDFEAFARVVIVEVQNRMRRQAAIHARSLRQGTITVTCGVVKTAQRTLRAYASWFGTGLRAAAAYSAIIRFATALLENS